MIVPAVVEWLGTSKIFEMIKEKRFKEIGREIISFFAVTHNAWRCSYVFSD